MQEMCECKIDLTVIVPVYDLEDYLAPLLASFQEQELGDYTAEYIFVLNNCTDNSEGVIRAAGFDNILTCTKQGCGHARNTGLEKAKGDYIWFMDGDDWLLSKTAIHDIIKAMRGTGLDILRVPFRSERFRMVYYSMVWQYVFKREFIKEFRFTGRQPGEDDEFMIKVLHKAGYSPATFLRMPYFREPLYFYNYLRIGSNMFRVFMGEDINGDE